MFYRTILLCAGLLLSASTVHADYVIIRVNINQLNFVPPIPGSVPGAMGGGVPGAQGGAVPGAQGGGVPGAQGGGVPGAAAGGVPGANMVGGLPGAAGGTPAAFIGFFPGGNVGNPPPHIPGGDPMGQPGSNIGGFPGMVEDPNARYLSTIFEIRNVKAFPATLYGTAIIKHDHRWGSNNWLVMPSPFVPLMLGGAFEAKAYSTEFTAEFNKAKGTKNVEDLLETARKCLARGQLKAFHTVMEEVVKLAPKHLNVKNYQKISTALSKKPAIEDPAQQELIDDWRAACKPHDSKKGHYRIYAQRINGDKVTEKTIERRLMMFEDVMETFYYWFAVQPGNVSLPAMPKYKLAVLLTGSSDEFRDRRLQWGKEPLVTEGFTPRRDNVIIMPARVRSNDKVFEDFEINLDKAIQDANQELTKWNIKITMTKDNLLSGEINDNKKESDKAMVYIGLAQTAVVLWHSLQSETERHAVTHEGVRQLLTASNMFPRNVQTPEWVILGLASLLETPAGAVYPTAGRLSWTHFINFKHFRSTKVLENPSQVMRDVISDKYVQDSRRLMKQFNDRPDEKSLVAARDAGELASCTAWALVYYLSQTNELEYLFSYGRELDKLPRDLDLSNAIMEGCFAKAFDMPDKGNPRRIHSAKFDGKASRWFDTMRQNANLDHVQMQSYFEKMRAIKSGLPAPGGTTTTPAHGGPGITPPGGPGFAPPGNPGKGRPPQPGRGDGGAG